MPALSQAYREAYRSLNPQQKRAVDTIEGPVMVIAGPGTGKTQVVATRIAKIVNSTDTSPEAILALTFTESGAKAMRERLVSLIGRDAYYVTISTFHSFCVDVIRENPDLFTINPHSEPLSELEHFRILQSILKSSRLRRLRPANSPGFFIQAIAKSIKDLKREGVKPEELESILLTEEEAVGPENKSQTLNQRKREIEKNRELVQIYRKYQETLKDSGRFDFEDMINFVVDAFQSNAELLLTYQERYHYFLVDEYQDTNSAQNELLFLLTSYWGENANIFAVGDPDQSIYRFQGASTENILIFRDKFPNGIIITLENNYRSGKDILEASTSVISHNSLRIGSMSGDISGLKPSRNQTSRPLILANPKTDISEVAFLVKDIKQAIKQGTSPSEICVIYRQNQDGHDLAQLLPKFGIDYTVQGGANILEDGVIQRLLKIFRTIKEVRYKEDDVDLFTILHYEIFSIDPLDILKLSRYAHENKIRLFEAIESSKIHASLHLSSGKNIRSVLQKISNWQELDARSTFIEFFEKVLNSSGYLNWILNSQDSHNSLTKINTLFSEVKRMNLQDHSLNLEKFLENITLMEQNNIRMEEVTFTQRKDAITLTTAHSAKGLEWERVYIYKCYDGLWGNNKPRDLIKLPTGILSISDLSKKEKNEDERRLFYVALTRAKKFLILTHASVYNKYGRSKEVSPSMFISEIPPSNLNLASVDNISQGSPSHLTKILTPSSDSTNPSSKEQAFLKNLVSDFTLSATSLNSYLECAYKFKLNKLLKLPRSKAPYLAFGSAVHAALESFYREMKISGKVPSEKKLISAFKSALHKEILTKEELETRTKEGEEILSAYYQLHRGNFSPPLFLEKYTTVQDGDVKLTGKIDRIEWQNEESRAIRVVDYKTGKPKSKNQILGSTQDSRGDLFRQLVFYKLLVDLDWRLRVKFGEAELDFVESPRTSNKSGKYRFKIENSDVTALRETIKRVMSEIRALNFSRTEDRTICARCEFKDHCWPNGLKI